MKKKTIVKISLDALMLVTLTLMYRKSALGIAFHEIGGLALIGAFVIHKLLNFSWIKNVTRKLFSHKTAAKTRLMYIVDFILLVLFALIGISGVFISKVVFDVSQGGGQVWKVVHYFSSALAITLIGVHIGLHFNYLKGIISRKVRLKRAIALSLAILMLCVGGYAMATGSYIRWMSMPFSTPGFNGGGQGPRGDMNRFGQSPDERLSGEPADNYMDGADDEVGEIDEGQAADEGGTVDEAKVFGKGDERFADGRNGMGGHHDQGIQPLMALWVFVEYAGIAFIWAGVTALIEMLIKRRKQRISPNVN